MVLLDLARGLMPNECRCFDVSMDLRVSYVVVVNNSLISKYFLFLRLSIFNLESINLSI